MPLEDEVVEQQQIEDEGSFLPDAPAEQPVRPAPVAAKQVSQPAPAVQAKPQVQQTISSELLDLAESMGIDRQTAASFGDNANLTRTLRLVSGRAARQEQQRQQPAPHEQKVEADPPLTFPDPEKLKQDGYEGPMLEMASTLKRMYDRVEKRLAELDSLKQHTQHIPTLLQAEQARQRQFIDSKIDAAAAAAGHQNLTPEQRLTVLRCANGLRDAFYQSGVSTDPEKLFAMAAQNVLGQPSQQTVPTPKNPVRQAAANGQERNINGTFAGRPTHRRVEQINGNRLRETMVDKGYDPGAPVPDLADGFLPG